MKIWAIIKYTKLGPRTVASVDQQIGTGHEPGSVSKQKDDGTLEVIRGGQSVKHGSSHPSVVQLRLHVQPRKLQDTGFGGVIGSVGQTTVCNRSRHGADQNDRSWNVGCNQNFGCVFCHDKRTNKVDIHDLSIQIERIVDSRQGLVNTGTIDQSVDRAAGAGGLLSEFWQQFFDLGFVADVQLVESQRAPVFLSQCFGRGPFLRNRLWEQVKSNCTSPNLKDGTD
ncbi:hypothetical protein OGAPHI_001374 [Ogataea philodendri]|uniref:Uncharacterized protein n=1 Tax=Ogataea philodendri TaxID=1378263 RepID=A0A9P8PBL4_9ASCO|nr:uncharacterized protein OGAPHI_001374 [Ogataea philodendri]KAH3669253.1 hypothetical protein OGAPHI_001374 [Ogataea philodendri]